MSSSWFEPTISSTPAPKRVQEAYVNVTLVLSPEGARHVVASLIVKRVNGGRDSRTRLFFGRIERLDADGRLLPLDRVLLAAVQDLPKDL